MPRIKGYDPQVSPVGPVGGQRASGVSIAPGIADLGAAADRIERVQKQRELSDLSVKASEAQARWEARTDDLLKSATPGDDITPKFIEEFDKDMDTLFGDASSPEAQMFARESRAKLKGHFQNKVQGGQAALAGVAAVENHRKSLQADAGSLIVNPDGFDLALERRQQKLAGDVAAGLIPSADAIKLQRSDAQELAVAAMNGRIDIAGRLAEKGDARSLNAAFASLEQARGMIGNGPLAQHIDADMQAALLNRIDGERNRLLNEQERKTREAAADARSMVERNFSDELASIELTGKSSGLVTPDMVRRAYPDDPDMVARLSGRIENAKSFYNARQKVALSSPADDAKLLQDMVAGAPGVNATQKAQQVDEMARALRAKYTALQEDPFGYLLRSSPELAKEGAAAQASADPEDFRAFLAKVNTLQAQVGVPDYARRFMGKDGAADFVAQVNLQNPEQAADQMEGLHARYADYWPEVLAELVDAKLDPGFATLARLDAPSDAVVRTDLAAALQTGQTELRKNVGDDANLIDDKVVAALEDYARTVQFDGARGQQMLAGERVSATLLAYSYRQRGASVNKAVEKAVGALLNDRYDYNDTYRTPAGQGGRVASMTQGALSRLTPDQFPMAESAIAGLTDDYRRRANWLDARRGVWANITVREPGSKVPRGGVELLYPNGSPVVLANGQRVRVMFDEDPGKYESYTPSFEAGDAR